MDTILKWAGGKSSLCSKLADIITPELLSGHKYYEPFCGSAALALYLEHPKTILNDINWELANLYRVVRDDPETLISILADLQNDHEKDKAGTFYCVRDWDKKPNWDNLNSTLKAARTVYLNKTGFNGLFRVNKKGFFNVPLGRTISGKVPDIVQEDKIKKLSEFLKTVEIRNLDFDESVGDAVSGDVIYFDPPYDKPSEDPTEFTMYHKDGFTRDDLVRLKQTCDSLVNRGCNVIVSNNDTEFVRNLFTGYNFVEVETKRSINPGSKTRRTGKELIIYKLN